MHIPASLPLTLLLACTLVLAAPASPAATQDASGTTKPKKKAASTPKIIPSGSEERPRDRERRLLRECKGRPNAGACSGYAS